MAIRAWIDKHPKTTVTVGLTLILVCGVIALGEFSPHRGPPKPPDKAFYTTDDGATYFADSFTRIPPFDHDGKPAVRAFVVSSDGGSHKWVAYLGKYSPEAQKKLQSNDPRADPHNMLVKAPGPAEWVPMSSADFSKLIAPPPGMENGPVEPVYP